MAPQTIDSFFKPSTEPPSTNNPNPKKRARETLSTESASTSKKPKPTTKSGPKLKKASTPTWEDAHLSQIAPMAPNAKKCVEKWGLLAPYDKRITEEQWATHYQERCALEIMNTCGSKKWKKIESEELMQKTEKLLVEAGRRLAGVILRSAGLEEERKAEIAETLRGSVYYLELWGCEDDGYHYHMFRDEGKYSVCAVISRDVSDCSGSKPTKCAAELQRNPNRPAESGTKLFNWTGKNTSGMPATSLTAYENVLFACNGWLSPYLMYQLLCAGATATIYQEPKQIPLIPQEKFKKFAGES